MSLVEKRFRFLYGTLFAIFILFGTSMTIIGATLPRILADFRWDYATAGAVIAAGAVGYFSATYLAGFLVSSLGAKATIAIGLALDVVGLALFAATPSALLNFILYLAIGLGQGCIELTVNWATLRMEKPGSGRAMSLIHGAFAVGAFGGPFAIGLLLKASLSWTLVYRGMSGILVLVLVAVLLLPFSRLGGSDEKSEKGGRPALFRRPAYWFGFIALFLYVGVEIGISNWVAEYFVAVFAAEAATGSFMVSLFWGGLLLGRFGAPAALRSMSREASLLLAETLMAASVVIVGCLGLFADGAGASGVFPVAAALVFLAGLGCSIVYPVVMTIVGGTFPRSQSQALAFASTGGGVGSFAFPFLMATMASAFGIKVGFASYGAFALLSVASAVLLVGAAKKESAGERAA